METVKTPFDFTNPPLVAMIQCRTKEECIEKIKSSLKNGAEAFGIQLCQLKLCDRTKESLTSIFAACEGKPIYVTSYRLHLSENLTEDECAELLLSAAQCGASLCDIPGDFYKPNKKQITTDRQAVSKQKELVKKLHKLNSQVLFSTHDQHELSKEEIFNIAKLQAEHGADVIKIVVKSSRKEMIYDYIDCIKKVSEEIKKPFLLLDSGAGKNILRKVGGFLGVCMYLCVDSYNEFDTKTQPVLKDLKQLREKMME